MKFVDWLGFCGVALVLFAYFGSILGRLKPNSLLFLSLNFIGSTIACIASCLIGYLPFVILEGIWAAISLFGLVKSSFFKASDKVP